VYIIRNIEVIEIKTKNFTLRFHDEQQHEEFKILCIKNKSSMQKEIMNMVEKYLKEGKK